MGDKNWLKIARQLPALNVFHSCKQENLANAKVSARQQEALSEEIYDKSTQGT